MPGHPLVLPLPKIMVGTPCLSNMYWGEYMNGLVDLVTCKKFNIVSKRVNYMSFLPHARNMLLTDFLESDCSHFLGVDSDIGFRAEHLSAMMQHGLDFVTGFAPMKVIANPDDYSSYHVKSPLNTIGDVLVELDWCGFPFVLLSKKLVRDLCKEHLTYVERGVTYYCLFESRVENGSYTGEDVSFCRQVREAGYQIWGDHRVVLQHFGTHTFGRRSVIDESTTPVRQ